MVIQMASTFKIGRSFFGTDDGAAAIEFALIAPVLLLAIAGMVEVGLIVSEKQKLQGIVREAAAGAVLAIEKSQVQSILDAAAATAGTTVNGEAFIAEPVVQICLCPSETYNPASYDEATSCDRTCGTDDLSISYEITASVDHTVLVPFAAAFITDRHFEETLRIKVR